MHFIPKLLGLLAGLFLLAAAPVALAAEAEAETAAPESPGTALCVVNAAHVGQYKKQDFDAALLTQLEACAADALAAVSPVADAYETEYLLRKAGVGDPFAAADGELAEALAGSGADYALLVRLEPFQHKNKQSMFSFKVQSSGALTLRVLELATGNVLFETQLTATAEKKDVTSYNQVIPLVMEKLCAELTKTLAETYPYSEQSAPDAAA